MPAWRKGRALVGSMAAEDDSGRFNMWRMIQSGIQVLSGGASLACLAAEPLTLADFQQRIVETHPAFAAEVLQVAVADPDFADMLRQCME